jgi:hypothetical protein
MNRIPFFKRAALGCTISFLCALSFFATSHAMAQNDVSFQINDGVYTNEDSDVDDESIQGDELRMHHPHCHKPKDRITLEILSLLEVSAASPTYAASYQLAITPFVNLPNGKTIFGETLKTTTGTGTFTLPPIYNVPAIAGKYYVGVLVEVDPEIVLDLTSFTFSLSNSLTASNNKKPVGIGGGSNTISSNLSPIYIAQFINDFIFLEEKHR